MAPSIRVVDGDTFYLDDVKIRIWGVDAPGRNDRGQTPAIKAYHDAGKAALEDIIDDGATCPNKKGDSWDREVRQCFTLERGEDIARLLVAKGYAVDDPRFSKGLYAKAEKDARRLKVGVWATITDSWR